MSDSLPENSFSGVLRVVKLITGEEIAGMVSEGTPDKITIKLPAKMEIYNAKDSSGHIVEYVKLTNYLASIKGFEISLSKNAILYIGEPTVDLEKMYEIYFMAMQSDANATVSSMPENFESIEDGLKLLNDLFNNDEFVGFVNELIDNFEGVEIFSEIEDDIEEEEETEPESVIEAPAEEEPEPQPKRKNRNKAKPEATKMPYNPDSPPENPESWSDNPMDYI